VSGVVGVRVFGVAADEYHGPGEGGGPGVVAVFGDFQDVAVFVGGARVGFVDLVGAAGRVVGEGAVHLAGGRAGFDVFWPVHLGGADRVSGEPSVDEDFCDGEPVDVAALCIAQRDPLAGAVECAVVGQASRAVDLVGRAVSGEPGHVQGS